MKGQFLKVGTKGNPFWVLLVFVKDHTTKFMEFLGRSKGSNNGPN